MSKQSAVRETKNWVEQFVIKHNLCPFARYPYFNDQVNYIVTDRKSVYTDYTAEVNNVIKHAPSEIETSLIIIADGYTNFMDYLDLVADAEEYLEEQELDGVLQVASFHPQYQFADLSSDDVRNYTNRSPYPMLHIIREDSISKAVDTYPDIDSIPEINQQKMLELGIEYFKK